ncbi:hypothetical protein LPB140_07555 [Sphingorhabdus lutea]|uniref:Uncharacterized protein n=2 Tax=Sphingorhabdus lutea TaxID=1913578 RepID=A0A1L3JC19_9SPHN|nr:hypothetical protein LPB140_07555 [Sphingorhabdus lutea]
MTKYWHNFPIIGNKFDKRHLKNAQSLGNVGYSVNWHGFCNVVCMNSKADKKELFMPDNDNNNSSTMTILLLSILAMSVSYIAFPMQIATAKEISTTPDTSAPFLVSYLA